MTTDLKIKLISTGVFLAVLTFAMAAKAENNPEPPKQTETTLQQQQAAIAAAASEANVGDVLASGQVGNVSSRSGGGHAQGGHANADSSFSPYKSFNTKIISEADIELHRAGLVLSGCRGSADVAGGKERSVFGIAWTHYDRDCGAIRNSTYVYTFMDDKPWAIELLCGRKSFKEADGRRENPVCSANGGKYVEPEIEDAEAEQVVQR